MNAVLNRCFDNAEELGNDETEETGLVALPLGPVSIQKQSFQMSTD